jgi:hypothetical protein
LIPLGHRNTESPNDVSANEFNDGPWGGDGRYLLLTRIVAQSSRSNASPGNR